jgi:hypothetical protein
MEKGPKRAKLLICLIIFLSRGLFPRVIARVAPPGGPFSFLIDPSKKIIKDPCVFLFLFYHVFTPLLSTDFKSPAVLGRADQAAFKTGYPQKCL